MNFNIDDPLGDLLSDNSLSNDNFFEQNAESSRNAANRNANKSATSKSRANLEDLFGIKEEKEEFEDQGTKKSSISSASLINRNPPLASSTPRKRTDKINITADDFGSNLDDDLGFDPKAPKLSNPASTNFDDWINKLDAPKRPAISAGLARKNDQTKPIMSRQSTDTTTDNSNFLQPQVRPKTAAGRRSSAQSSTAPNTEGIQIYGSSNENSKQPEVFVNYVSAEKPASGKKYSTADWLGLNQTEPKEEVPRKVIQNDHIPKREEINIEIDSIHAGETQDILGNEKTVTDPINFQSNQVEATYTKVSENDNTMQNILALGNRNLETNHAFQALQHQEGQLALATQMKVQERALLELQHKQDDALKYQEQQFQSLLQQQIVRQQQMEDHIRMQQQRINSHIKMLMAQPAIISNHLLSNSGQDEDPAFKSPLDDNRNKSNVDNPNAQNDINLMEIEIKRLETEKMRLEEILENVQSNYEKEIELLHHSYKKQLEVVEEHREAVEMRLKTEIDSCKEYYSGKLKDMEVEYNRYKSEAETNMHGMQGDHEDHLRKLRKAHEDDLDMMKDEHRRMIERIRQTKALEFAAVQGGNNYLETLKAASTNLDHISGDLQEIRDEMHSKIKLLHDEKDRQLELRERKLEDKERFLKMSEESTEAEKKRLMDLVSTLELQLAQLAKESSEENWHLRTKMSSLEAEKAAFEREKEFIRDRLSRDEKRLEELKDLQLTEHQRKLADIQEERIAIMVERKKLEAERKIQSNFDFEKNQLEVEAQFAVAQTAIKQAEAERDRYIKLQRGLEQQQRIVLEKENLLTTKQAELESGISQSRLTDSKAQSAIKKAQYMEHQFLAKIQLLQKRLRQLNEREAHLAQDRFLVTQERIALHKYKAMLSERNCALCKLACETLDINETIRSVQFTDPPDFGNKTILPDSKNPSSGIDLVDRLLDDNIEESLRRMKNSVALDVDFWNESGLDDDTKNIALSNLDGSNLNIGANSPTGYLHFNNMN